MKRTVVCMHLNVFFCALVLQIFTACKKNEQPSETALLTLNHKKVGSISQTSALPGGKRLFGYLTGPNFGDNIDYFDSSLLSDVCLTGPPYDGQGNIPITAQISQAVTKGHTKGLNMYISIGGNGTISDTLLEPQNRAGFISKLRTYLVNNNFEGIDIDFEGEDLENPNMNTFIIQLSDTLLNYNKKLSMAIARYQGHLISQAAYARLDFLNPMIYDYRSRGTAQPHASFAQFKTDVDYFLTKVPAAKINAGIPGYAYTIVDGNSLNQIGFRYAVALNVKNAFVNYLVKSSNEVWYYDGHPVIKQKVAYMMQKNLGGIMFFHLICDTQDDRTSLLKLINYCFANPNGFNPLDSYTLINIGSGKVMMINGASTANGAAVVQGAGNSSMLWRVNHVNGENFGILNINSGKALDVTGGSMLNGAPLSQWPFWNQALNQLYTLSPNDKGYYVVKNVNSNKVLQIANGSSGDGAAIVQNTPNGSVGQQWVLLKQ